MSGKISYYEDASNASASGGNGDEIATLDSSKVEELEKDNLKKGSFPQFTRRMQIQIKKNTAKMNVLSAKKDSDFKDNNAGGKELEAPISVMETPIGLETTITGLAVKGGQPFQNDDNHVEIGVKEINQEEKIQKNPFEFVHESQTLIQMGMFNLKVGYEKKCSALEKENKEIKEKIVILEEKLIDLDKEKTGLELLETELKKELEIVKKEFSFFRERTGESKKALELIAEQSKKELDKMKEAKDASDQAHLEILQIYFRNTGTFIGTRETQRMVNSSELGTGTSNCICNGGSIYKASNAFINIQSESEIDKPEEPQQQPSTSSTSSASLNISQQKDLLSAALDLKYKNPKEASESGASSGGATDILEYQPFILQMSRQKKMEEVSLIKTQGRDGDNIRKRSNPEFDSSSDSEDNTEEDEQILTQTCNIKRSAAIAAVAALDGTTTEGEGEEEEQNKSYGRGKRVKIPKKHSDQILFPSPDLEEEEAHQSLKSLKAVTPSGSLPCCVCEKRFSTKILKFQHEWFVHGVKGEGYNGFLGNCKRCNKEYRHKGNLNIHEVKCKF